MQHKNYITRYVDPITISEFYQITFVNVTRCIEFGRKFQWKCYYLIVVSIQIFIISLRFFIKKILETTLYALFFFYFLTFEG